MGQKPRAISFPALAQDCSGWFRGVSNKVEGKCSCANKFKARGCVLIMKEKPLILASHAINWYVGGCVLAG